MTRPMMGFGLQTRKRPIDGSSNLPRATSALARRREYVVRLVEDAFSEEVRKLPRFDDVSVLDCQSMGFAVAFIVESLGA